MISLCGTYFSLENHQSTLFKTGRKDFHNELVEKIFSGYPPSGSKMLLHEHMKKRERSMLLFKLDTSHARMGLLLPRSGSRVNKSQLPDESSNDSEPLCELHFQLALFFSQWLYFFSFLFALAFSFSFQKKKTGFILALEFPLLTTRRS